MFAFWRCLYIDNDNDDGDDDDYGADEEVEESNKVEEKSGGKIFTTHTGKFPVFVLVNHPVKCTLATLTFAFVLLNKLHVENSKTRVKSWNIYCEKANTTGTHHFDLNLYMHIKSASSWTIRNIALHLRNRELFRVFDFYHMVKTIWCLYFIIPCVFGYVSGSASVTSPLSFACLKINCKLTKQK